MVDAEQGIIVELPLAPFFLKKLLRRGLDVNDLPTLDAELYRSLMLLREYEGDAEDLSLTFTLTEDHLGEIKEVRRHRTTLPSGRQACVRCIQMGKAARFPGTHGVMEPALPGFCPYPPSKCVNRWSLSPTGATGR